MAKLTISAIFTSFYSWIIELKLIEMLLNPHLTSDSCVTDLFKMLTYLNVCRAFSSACALLSNAI